ncbi:MAG TPA: hypothetical protein VF842_02375, partial [Flavobacterium sp.]
KIKASVEVFESDPFLVHVASPAKHVDLEGRSMLEHLPIDLLEKPLDGFWLLRRFYNNNLLFGGGSTFAARASVLKNIEIPDSVDMFIDEFLLLAVLPFGKSFFFANPLSIWRVHNLNYSGNYSRESSEIKGLRLLKSSAAVLAFLKDREYPNCLIKVYQLQDANRRMVFKESLNIKSNIDIINYFKEVFFQIRPELNLIRKYYVLHRLVPTRLFRGLKALNSVLVRSSKF